MFGEQIGSNHQNNDSGISIYDQLYQVIGEEIAKYENDGPVLVSWLTDKERVQALRHLEEHPIPTDISFINDPFNQPMPQYKMVNYKYFSNNKRQLNAEASGNSRMGR